MQSNVIKKVLVTGFEPFAGASVNPSQLVIAELAKLKMPHTKLITRVLPVEYEEASKKLLELIEQNQPEVVLALGQAEGRSEISIEKVAVNQADANLADNSGRVLINQKISEDGQLTYLSSLPIPSLVTAIEDFEIRATMSLSAGSFVCNYIFYRMQEKLASKDTLSGFIHLPLVPEQQIDFPGKPTMPLIDQVTAVKVIITELIRKFT